MKINKTSTIDMEQFKLKWRWTDASYCLMPTKDLTQIFPLNNTESEKAFKKSLSFPNGGTENSINNPNFKDAKTDVIQNTDIENWLNEKIPKGQIIISWQPDTAVITQKEIFIKYWSEFCYPSSDDVTIWSEKEDWVLQYRHFEQFWYGELKTYNKSVKQTD